MSTAQEIKAAIPKLTPQEQVELKEWLEEFFEDQLELNDEVKSKLDQARQEIREGKYRTRQPQ
jgi:ABC-type Zn uptake system ZnuABC Zn-binding protein ZnuA